MRLFLSHPQHTLKLILNIRETILFPKTCPLGERTNASIKESNCTPKNAVRDQNISFTSLTKEMVSRGKTN